MQPQTRSQTPLPGEPEADRQVEGDTRDWQINSVRKNPSFRQGTHFMNQPRCSSHSSPSHSLGEELEATAEQRTKNMDFLEHEKEAWELWEKWKKKKIKICVGFN